MPVAGTAQRYVFDCAGRWCAGECEPVRVKLEPGDAGRRRPRVVLDEDR
jgi:hypothetical protein